MSLGAVPLFGGGEDSPFLQELKNSGTSTNTAPGNTYNVGAFGRGQATGLANVLGLGSPTRGIIDGLNNESQVSSAEKPFYGRQGEELGRGSLRGRLGNRGFELRTPRNVNESVSYLSTEKNPQGDGFNSNFSFGGNENTLGFNYDNSGDNILAQSGFAGGRLTGDGSIQADTRYGNINNFSTSGEYNNASNYGRTFSSNKANISGSIASPTDFSYNDTFNQRVVGGARTASATGAKTMGEDYGGIAGAYYDTPQQIGYSVLSAGLDLIPGVGQFASYLTAPIGQALFGGPTVVTKDFASAKVAGQQNLGASAGLTGEGNVSIGRNARVGGVAEAISPIYGNRVQSGVDINTDQKGDLSLKGQGISGSLGLDSQQLGEAASGLHQTNLFRKGGALMKGMNKNIFVPMGYQGITQNAGGQVALIGNQDDAYGLANINQLNTTELMNNIQASDKGYHSRYRNPEGQLAQSEQNIGAELQGRADILAGADNQLDLYNSGIVGGGGMRTEMKAQSQAAVEAALKAAGAKVDAYAEAKQLLKGDLNNATANAVRVEAQRFTDSIAEKFPNSPEAQAIIDFIRQDPANAWLFTGDNSPEVIMSAMANSKSATQGGYRVIPGYYGTGNHYELTRNDVNANISIDPNANTNVERYYTHDPTPGEPNSGDEMVFANVNGEVREIPKGQLANINFRDQFNINANAQANNAFANLSVQGNVKGRDYYFASGEDQIYNQLANEIVQRSENTWNPEGVEMVKGLKTINTEMEKAQANLPKLASQHGTGATIRDPDLVEIKGGFIPLYKNTKTNMHYYVHPAYVGQNVYNENGYRYTTTPTIPTIENPYVTEQRKIQELSGSQATLTQQIQQNTQANQTTQNDPYIQQIRELQSKALSPEDKAYLNQLIDQRANELNQGYSSKEAEAQEINTLLDQAFEEYSNLRNTNPAQISDVGRFQEELAKAEQKMNTLSDQLRNVTQGLGEKPDKTKIGYADVRDQFLVDRDASKYADSYDLAGNAMFNNRSVADYNDLLAALEAERQFDAQRGIAQGGNYIDFDAINANASSRQKATIDRSNTWYWDSPNGAVYTQGRSSIHPNIVRTENAQGYLDPTTGQFVNSGNSNMYNRFNLTGYNPNMLNEPTYDPVNLNLTSYGVDQYFDPIRYHNDNNFHRLQRNRFGAVDSANANMIQGGDFWKTQ